MESRDAKTPYWFTKFTYKIYKDSNFKEEYKKRFYEAKKLFRAQKRLMTKLKTNKKLSKLNELFKSNSD